MKLELVLLIILIIIAIILITTLYSNFSDGKIFTKCSKCGENKIYHFDVPELPKGQIDSLYELFKKKTNKLDPKKNFKGDRYGECASITVDEDNNVKTVFFNGDCFGKRGHR